MREILFRGKRKTHNEWTCGDLVHCDDKIICISNLHGYFVHIKPETVGQFTGLTDKNGKKIFEGDIVDILTENEEIGFVAYDDGGFLVKANGFCVDFHANINGTDLEIIGNIHDNPEMLEEVNGNA